MEKKKRTSSKKETIGERQSQAVVKKAKKTKQPAKKTKVQVTEGVPVQPSTKKKVKTKRTRSTNVDSSQPQQSVAVDRDALFSKSAWKSSLADSDKKLQSEQAAKVAEQKQKQQAKREALEQAAAERTKKIAAEKRQLAEETAAAEAAIAQDKKKAKIDVKPKRSKSSAGEPSNHIEDLGPGSTYRKANGIVVDKASCPAPIESFDALQSAVGSALLSTLTEQGYTAPTPIQAQAWPIAIQGSDMVAVAETGSGKTCGFLLPALVRIAARGTTCPVPRKIDKYFSEPCLPSTLVLAPTRELAQQISGEAAKFSKAAKARVVCIYGGVPKGEHVRELKQGTDVLIATPGRLVDFVTPKAEQEFKVCISLSKVTYFVLDEADRMLDMGFEPDIRKIVDMCPKPEEGGRQTLFFTATWPKSVKHVAASLTKDAVQIRIGQSSGSKLTANKNVKQIVQVLDYNKKLPRLIKILKDELKSGETAIVFAATKGGCDYLGRNIQNEVSDLWVGTIHGNKDQWERDKSLGIFRKLTAGKDEKRGVLIATDVAARGLDIPGVPMVVVYDFCDGRGNSGEESYVHRIGRTGRGGLTGRAITFFSSGEAGARELLELLRGAGQEVPKDLEKLAQGRADKSRTSGGWRERSSW